MYIHMYIILYGHHRIYFGKKHCWAGLGQVPVWMSHGDKVTQLLGKVRGLQGVRGPPCCSGHVCVCVCAHVCVCIHTHAHMQNVYVACICIFMRICIFKVPAFKG